MRQRSWRIEPITPRKFYHRVHTVRALGDNDVMRWIAVLAGIALLPACFESRLRYCANGGICPETLACTEHDEVVCGEPEDVDACKAIGEGKACSSDLTPVGTCASGTCTMCDATNLECRYPAWTAMASGATQALRGLWVNADADVYAVGDGGLILHYDGAAWSKVDGPTRSALPVTDTFNGVWASGAELFIVAQQGESFRFNNSWATIPAIPCMFGACELFGIWGIDAQNVYAVGQGGTIARLGGAAWQPMMSAAVGVLASIHGRSASDLYAVGGAGEIQRYNGSSWQDAPATPVMGLRFNGVWTSPSDAVIVVGTMTATSTAQIYAKSSAGWNSISGAPARTLNAVWGRADDDVFAVGAGNTGGVILHFDGSGWSEMPHEAGVELHAIAGTDRNVFAVGAGGTILRYAM